MISLMLLAMFAQISPDSIPQQKLVTSAGEEVKCKLVWEGHSRIPTRICRTKAKWEAIAAEIQKDYDEARRPRGACQINEAC